ncbi:MAG TPA: sulfatase [Thermoanaerobaculia bacterium]
MTWSDPARSRRWSSQGWALAAPLLAVLLAATACGRPQGFDLRGEVAAKRFSVGQRAVDGLRFTRRPELRDVEMDHERRPVVLTSSAPWSWRGRVPKRAQLHAGAQLLPAAWGRVRHIEVQVVASCGDEREVLAIGRSAGRDGPPWIDLHADLSRYAGRIVTVEFAMTLAGLPAEFRDANLVAWGPVDLSAPPQPARRPNVLFILVDTLRRDRLTPYGYQRDTSPSIAHWLAAPGTVVEDAYSQAPWTLPSVVSFMTGRYPGALLGNDPAAYGIPTGVRSLNERMAALGFETGGFIANPVLHEGAGFERGFRTLYVPPADVEWLRKHADELNRHAVPWLLANQDRPFYLYVHYVDPHDPYDNPEIVGNRSPFEPAQYSGPIAGDWVHGIYSGKLQLTDPQRDIAHIGALYDSEVHYVDRYIGELLASLRPEVLANTLIVLTADHGEELFDHGGWKHGQTLYDEQIHVPLIFRWDGRIAAGRRLGGTVRLLDLLPTLMDAVSGPTDPAWEGVDLLPALTGGKAVPKRPAFAQHLSSGPLRAAAVLDREKLIVFNQAQPWKAVDDVQSHLLAIDQSRLKPIELYDLAHDPRERQNLAAARPESVARLEPVIHRQLDAALPGLRLFSEGVAPGSRLTGTIVFERTPQSWLPYFLAPDDRVELRDRTLTFDFAPRTGGGPALRIGKGLVVDGDFGRIVSLTASLDGKPMVPAQIRIGSGTAYDGRPVTPSALRSSRWPGSSPSSGSGSLRLWTHDAAAAGQRRTEHDPETERRLRALGYIQ